MKIVQIGTNNGKDHVNIFAKHFNEQIDIILLVEPLEELNNEIYRNYQTFKNVHLENVVISNKNDNYIFYVNPRVTTHSSLYKHHLHKCNHKDENIQYRIIKGSTIESLFNKYKITNLTCLFIDTEGSDIDIIKQIDFNKFDISYIVFEHAHSVENIYEYENSLKSFGYTILKLNYANSILIKNKDYMNDLVFKKILDVFRLPHNMFINTNTTS